MEQEITKEYLLSLLKERQTGNRNIKYLQELLGEEVFNYVREQGDISVKSFWQNSQDGNHSLRINTKNGRVTHDCEIALVEDEILLPNHKYETTYREVILKFAENLLLR